MADETHGKENRSGRFELGRSYEEVEPDLGRLHEAWHVETGMPALRLYPTDRVEWQPSGLWEVIVVCEASPIEPSPASITMLVNGAPMAVPMTELADVFVLTSAALTRVEDNAGISAHLAPGLNGLQSQPHRPALPNSRQARGHVIAGLALALSGCLLTRPHAPSERNDSFEEQIQQEAQSLVYFGNLDAQAVLGYPLPEKPFRNQAVPPCPRKKSIVEINGGCWAELAHKPPCEEDQAEYQGKCYLPGAKQQPVPRAVEP
ncbi:hypothetical protein [Cystobacter fuscus]|nr:hypothetical protein [Cystobacter fuscus]